MRIEVQEQQLRAKKDERPAPKSRKWTEVPMVVDEKEVTGLLAESGHWIYFSPDSEQWYKLNTVTLKLTELLVIKTCPPPSKKTDEEKKEARKARREARQEKKVTPAIEDQEKKDKIRHMKRKAAAYVSDPDQSP